MNDDDLASTIKVRMRVHLGWLPVGGPAGMADADGPPWRLLLQNSLELSELADATSDLDAATAQQCETGRVVAAVLEAPQSLEDNARRILLADVSYDSTHRRVHPRCKPGQVPGHLAVRRLTVIPIRRGRSGRIALRSLSHPRCATGRHPRKFQAAMLSGSSRNQTSGRTAPGQPDCPRRREGAPRCAP